MDNVSQRSYISQAYSNISRFTDDDAINDSKIDVAKTDHRTVANNRIMRVLYVGIDYLAEKKFEDAIESFNNCLEVLEAQDDHSNMLGYHVSLVHCNIAICYFFMNNFAECENCLNKASNNLNIAKNLKEEEYRVLYLKILCNFLVLYVKTKEYENFNQITELIVQFIRSESDPLKQANYFISVVYVLFRADSIQTLNAKEDMQNCDQLSPQSYGIYLMVSAVNYDFTGQKEKASQTFFKALEHWQSLDDQLMCLLTLRYQLHVNENNRMTFEKIKRYYIDLADSLEYGNMAIDQLFEDFDTKLSIVKELVHIFKDLENSNFMNIAKLKELNSVSLVKVAIRLSLKQSITSIKTVLKHGRDSPAKLQEMQESLFFIEKTLALLEADDSQSMVNLITNHAFVKKSLNRVKTAVSTIERGVTLIYCKNSFNVIKAIRKIQIGQKKAFGTFELGSIPRRTPSMRNFNHLNPKSYVDNHINISMTESVAPHISEFSQRAKEITTKGDHLVKLNYTTNGHMNKFFRVVGGVSLRWANKPELLNNIKNCHSHMFADIRGILYGKCTKTFQKSKNKQLSSWLCFSLILKNRSLDVYCTEDQIDFWYVGLSQFVKLHNPSAFALSKGRYYWRKLKYLLIHEVMRKLDKKMKKTISTEITFCKAICLYGVLARVY